MPAFNVYSCMDKQISRTRSEAYKRKEERKKKYRVRDVHGIASRWKKKTTINLKTRFDASKHRGNPVAKKHHTPATNKKTYLTKSKGRGKLKKNAVIYMSSFMHIQLR